MKRLDYLDYVKTPDDWKRKALDIPRQVQSVRPHRSLKPSAMLVACALVVSLSGMGVYAYENGSLDIIRSKLFNDRQVQYSYEGTYNDTIEMSDLDEYFNTTPIVDHLEVSGDATDFQVNGYLCDRDKCIMVAQLTLPEGSTFKYNSSSAIDHHEILCLDDNGNESKDATMYSSYVGIQKVDGNVVYILLEANFYQMDETSNDSIPVGDKSYRVSFGDLGNWDYTSDSPQFTTDYNFDVSFDITIRDSGISKTVDNINKTITLKDGTTTTIKSIDYSPLKIDFNFDTMAFSKDFFEYSSTQNKIANQFTIYYIYSDGKKVLVHRDQLWHKLSYTDTDGTNYIDTLYIDYEWNQSELVDFTNVVAIEINGEVVPLT